MARRRILSILKFDARRGILLSTPRHRTERTMTETAPPPAATGEHMLLQRRDDIRDRIVTLIESAHRSIAIFAPELDPGYFSTQRVTRLITSFAARHRNNRMRILTEDEKHAVRTCVRLVDIARRMSEFVGIRAVGERHTGIHEMFVIIDNCTILHQEDTTRVEAVLRVQDRTAASVLTQRFAEMWDHSTPVGEISTAGL
jgi:hypothetical protein